MLENTEGAIKNGQSRENGNIVKLAYSALLRGQNVKFDKTRFSHFYTL